MYLRRELRKTAAVDTLPSMLARTRTGGSGPAHRAVEVRVPGKGSDGSLGSGLHDQAGGRDPSRHGVPLSTTPRTMDHRDGRSRVLRLSRSKHPKPPVLPDRDEDVPALDKGTSQLPHNRHPKDLRREYVRPRQSSDR